MVQVHQKECLLVPDSCRKALVERVLSYVPARIVNSVEWNERIANVILDD